jgi:hypothetical protein
VKHFGKPPPQSLPFAFIAVDPVAAFNGTLPGIDAFIADVWSAELVEPHPKKIASMQWFFAKTPAPPVAAQLLRTSCTQPSSNVQPGTPGLAVGIRDFGEDYVAPTPPGAFEPPKGAVCVPHAGVDGELVGGEQRRGAFIRRVMW